MYKLIMLLASLFAIWSCGEDDEKDSQSEVQEVSGRDLYLLMLPNESSKFTCSTCHALNEPTVDQVVLAGHPIADAPRRPSFKNGQLTRFEDAVNVCIEDWFGGTKWEYDDPKFAALTEYLLSESTNENPPALTFEVVDPPADLTGGDVDKGKVTFNKTCAVCHGMNAVGGSQGPNLAGTELSREKIAERIRKSGPAEGVYTGLTGGRMPFWAKDRLSDEEMINIMAYLETTEVTDSLPTTYDPDNQVTEDGLGINLSVQDSQSNCSSTHPKVGTKANLSTITHDVSGELEIIDDCTIKIKGFNFDGGGIEVKMYAGVNGNYDNGPELSLDFYSPGVGFNNQDVFFRLPNGVTLDDFNGVSVWCTAVGISFGDTTF